MPNEKFTDVRSLLKAFAAAMNLINPEVEGHHQQTAYLAYMIVREMGISEQGVETAVYAALLHDIGSVVSETQQSVMEIEADARNISLIGAEILSDIPGLKTVSEVIRRCQLSWSEISVMLRSDGREFEECAQIASAIHLADVVSAVLEPDIPVLQQRVRITEGVMLSRGKEFSERAADAFERLSKLEFIWLDLRYNPEFLLLFTGEIRYISLDNMVELTKLMSRVIDYRSSFTAMHSAGVAASAVKLAELAGMSGDECKMMRIAGNLHDIGKLKVPREILEKPGKLTDDEFSIIKEHAYFTRLILMDVTGFEKIRDWAGYHHEKLNGNGYPFKFGADMLDTGSRILAIADIFSAITEVRPYRGGMPKEKAISVLEDNVNSGGLCPELTRLLIDNYEVIDAARARESEEAGKRYFDSLRQCRE